MTNSTRKYKILKRLAVLLLAIAVTLISVGAFASCGEPRGAEAAELFLPNVVRVTASDGDGASVSPKYGSGVIAERRADGSVLCLTNYHVVSDKTRVVVTGNDGIGCEAEVLGYSAYHDIAVLSVSSSYACDFTDIIAEGKIAYEAGGDAYSIGNRNNEGLQISKGSITGRSKIVQAARLVGQGNKFVPVIKTSADISEGVSGGALLDDYGKLTAICAYRDEEGFYAVPVGAALAVLDAVRRGETDSVPLMGSGVDGAGIRLLSSYGELGVLVSNGDPGRIHAAGFRGVVQVDGIYVTYSGEECPLNTDTLITEVGGVKATADNICSVFGAFYGYSTDGAGDVLKLKLSDGSVVDYSGGGISLKKK